LGGPAVDSGRLKGGGTASRGRRGPSVARQIRRWSGRTADGQAAGSERLRTGESGHLLHPQGSPQGRGTAREGRAADVSVVPWLL